jgi:hypothetical protein
MMDLRDTLGDDNPLPRLTRSAARCADQGAGRRRPAQAGLGAAKNTGKTLRSLRHERKEWRSQI